MNCNAIFQKRPTEKGMCCSFNMPIAEKILKDSKYKKAISERQSEEAKNAFEDNQRPKWYNENNEPTPKSGIDKGLTIVVDGHSDKLSMGSVTTDFKGFRVVVDDRNMFPWVSRTHLIARPGHDTNIKVGALRLDGKNEIRKYSPERRQCYFPDEYDLELHQFYSQSNCIFECETSFATRCLTTCKDIGRNCDCSNTTDFLDEPLNLDDSCNPWFYPAKDLLSSKICDPWSSKKFQDILKNRIPDDHCNYCLPDCTTTKYDTSISYAGFRKCDVNNIGGSKILCSLTDNPLNPAPWTSMAQNVYQKSNESIPWFLTTMSAGVKPNTTKFSNVRSLQPGIFATNLEKDLQYDAFEKDIGIVNVFFTEKKILKYVMRNKMSLFGFVSQIGGSLGLAMGISIISIVEVFYWFTYRFLRGN